MLIGVFLPLKGIGSFRRGDHIYIETGISLLGADAACGR